MESALLVLMFANIGVDQSVHARILQGAEKAITKCFDGNQPDRGGWSDGGK